MVSQFTTLKPWSVLFNAHGEINAHVCNFFQYFFFALVLNRGYQMSVGEILNLMNELNKSILCEPLESIILFYSTSSINIIMNLHEFNILSITYPQKTLKNCKKILFFTDTTNCYYTSVILFLLNGFITLLYHVLCDKMV